MKSASHSRAPSTRAVPPKLFQQIYDSPHSLGGKHRWVTKDEDVRAIEKILEIPERSIVAPLWVSGDTRHCPKCGPRNQLVGYLFIRTNETAPEITISPGDPREHKYVNVEVPRAIADLSCYNYETSLVRLGSFKCHNWA